MPVFTFSTKKQIDTELIKKVKAECEAKGLVFSSVVIAAIRDQHADKVRNNK